MNKVGLEAEEQAGVRGQGSEVRGPADPSGELLLGGCEALHVLEEETTHSVPQRVLRYCDNAVVHL